MSKAKEFIKDCTRGCSNELCAVEDRYGKQVVSYHEWLTPEQALRAVEIEKEELIEKVCDWIENNAERFLYWHKEFNGPAIHDLKLTTELIQAMKGE